MSLFRTLIEGFGSRRFVEGGLLTDVQGKGDAPSTTRPMSPADELELLEHTARDKGIPSVELDTMRRIGECPAQVQTRIKQLHEWLASH